MKTEPGQKKHLFTNKQLWALLVPVVVEQILNSLMGTADTMMVSNVGSAAISAVSLVDSINLLVIQVFAALAAGGTIICSQYMTEKYKKCHRCGKTADFYYHGDCCSTDCSLCGISDSTVASDLRKSGSGSNDQFRDILPVYSPFVSVYCSF